MSPKKPDANHQLSNINIIFQASGTMTVTFLREGIQAPVSVLLCRTRAG
jgi:hypothetical protein